MTGRLLKEESGVAMGLAVILIVIIGVMGAGLLVFVRNDLEAVLQTNQGQEAFEATEAGVQAAKRQLLSDASEESYDGDASGDLPWSYDQDGDSGGKILNFDDKQVNVSIRHLDPASGESQTREENYTPVVVDGDDERRFFKVVSTGESEGGDARRKVEAIYSTYELGFPKAYYSPQTIRIRGTGCIEGISVFSLTSIQINGGGNGCGSGNNGGSNNGNGNNGNGNGNGNGGGNSGGGNNSSGNITGEDLAYGDWQNTYNATARGTTDAGFAAVDDVSVGEDGELGTRDFDGSTEEAEFVAEPSDDPQDSDEITFPFDHESQSGQADQDRLDFLKQRADAQGNLHTDSGDIRNWPDDADDRTVVYIEANGGRVDWKINGGGGNSGCPGDDALKGTLVVNGAGLKVAGNRKPFNGVTIVRGGTFDSRGNSCWAGPVSADGGIEIRGNASPSVAESVLDRPGFYGVEQWSWRELYE